MAGPARIASAPQQGLLASLARCGKLVLAVGPEGVSANLVGVLHLRRHGVEDFLDVDEGRQHLHVDWRRVKRIEIGVHDGEGLITFYDGIERLFGLYRPGGPFPSEVARFADVALWPSEAGDR